MTDSELLTPKQMYMADSLAIAKGTSGETLMQNAGKAVATVITDNYSPCPVAVLCGPGNNGGDGFVVARLLDRAGFKVQIFATGAIDDYSGDARLMANQLKCDLQPLSLFAVTDYQLIVDGLFAAGLARNISGEIARLIDQINLSDLPVVSIDMPSGIDGESGQIRGIAIKADHSATFFRQKPGHVLLPGRTVCGQIHVCDIGIPEQVLEQIDNLQLWENSPKLWRSQINWRRIDGHKYDYGHTVVLSGDQYSTGAARMAAMAALRSGSGLVSIASPDNAMQINAAHLTEIMLRCVNDHDDLYRLLADTRLNSVVLGPGGGITKSLRYKTLAALKSPASVLLDADALTSFADNPDKLFTAIKARKGVTILTPHAGEFSRLFAISQPSKIESARIAAITSGAILVLKGADTIIAHPDGRAIVNTNAPPELATAGSGDVLAGIIAGLLAQNMAGFQAAACGVWLHGQAANLVGTGLIATDLLNMLPVVLKNLKNN